MSHGWGPPFLILTLSRHSNISCFMLLVCFSSWLGWVISEPPQPLVIKHFSWNKHFPLFQFSFMGIITLPQKLQSFAQRWQIILSCVLSERRLFLPGLGWPFFSAALWVAACVRARCTWDWMTALRVVGWRGLDESAGELQRLHLSGFGLLVPAPASS